MGNDRSEKERSYLPRSWGHFSRRTENDVEGEYDPSGDSPESIEKGMNEAHNYLENPDEKPIYGEETVATGHGSDTDGESLSSRGPQVEPTPSSASQEFSHPSPLPEGEGASGFRALKDGKPITSEHTRMREAEDDHEPFESAVSDQVPSTFGSVGRRADTTQALELSETEQPPSTFGSADLRAGTVQALDLPESEQTPSTFGSVGLRADTIQALEPSETDQPPSTFVVRIAGIRFGYACKIYHFDAGDMDLTTGDWVIVKTEKGVGLGQVAMAPVERVVDAALSEALRKIIRKAGKVDFEQKAKCSQREAEAYAYCEERIEELGLPMKLVAVECFFDGSKYVFYFTAEGRIDFRELVKQLVARFPVRIEMRQIGVRHEAKMTGGLACCGQELCCSRFLTDFRPVSVKMAKNQNLSLNPTKISGVCGRLMCCLAYEHDAYEHFKKGLPKVGKTVRTSRGDGVVVKHNPLTETICIRFDDETAIDMTKDDILVENEAPMQKKGDKEKGTGKRTKTYQNKDATERLEPQPNGD